MQKVWKNLHITQLLAQEDLGEISRKFCKLNHQT